MLSYICLLICMTLYECHIFIYRRLIKSFLQLLLSIFIKVCVSSLLFSIEGSYVSFSLGLSCSLKHICFLPIPVIAIACFSIYPETITMRSLHSLFMGFSLFKTLYTILKVINILAISLCSVYISTCVYVHLCCTY